MIFVKKNVVCIIIIIIIVIATFIKFYNVINTVLRSIL